MSRLLPILLLLTSCAASHRAVPAHTSRVALGAEFTLAQKGSASLGDTGYLVTFAEVLEDSRCPAAVDCIWEGNARVSIAFIEFDHWGGNAVEVIDQFNVELNTSARFSGTAIQGGFRIELKKLAPTPRADTATTGYVVTLSITKA
jgi:hypothetical protein